MSALPTRIEREVGRPLTPLEIFDITAARRKQVQIQNALVSVLGAFDHLPHSHRDIRIFDVLLEVCRRTNELQTLIQRA
jgi:hypothetical protein